MKIKEYMKHRISKESARTVLDLNGEKLSDFETILISLEMERRAFTSPSDARQGLAEVAMNLECDYVSSVQTQFPSDKLIYVDGTGLKRKTNK